MADWSVLNADLTQDTRQALAAINADARRGMAQAVGTLVLRKLAADIHPWFSRGMHDYADLDVFAAELREGTLVLHFLADHYNYNFAQSGSDWADHYFYVGEIHVVAGRRTKETFALERHVHLTEQQDAHYRPSDAVELFRAELLARWRGTRPDTTAFDAAVQAARDAAAGRSSAAPAQQPDPEPEKTYRCPKCSSRDVKSEPYFDDYQMGCRACGHTEFFNHYPDGEEPTNWEG